MIKEIFKFLLFAVIFFLLIFWQSSLFYFWGWGFLPLVLIVAWLSFSEKPNSSFSIYVAFMAGFLLDIYSSVYFFGFYALVFSMVAIILKLIVYRYVKVF